MANDKTAAFGFGKKLEQLEAITTSLEQDGVDLDKGLAQFDEGMKLVSELRAYLNEAVGRVEEIKQKYDLPQAEGQPEPEPTDNQLPF
jgi:exodeoxyribonuclease VII small subunit